MRVVKVLRVFLWRWRCPVSAARESGYARVIHVCPRGRRPRRSPAACPTAPGPYQHPTHA
eukprot:3095155-Prymnesium_polylepis.1